MSTRAIEETETSTRAKAIEIADDDSFEIADDGGHGGSSSQMRRRTSDSSAWELRRSEEVQEIQKGGTCPVSFLPFRTFFFFF